MKETCKYCTEYEDLPEHFVDGMPVGKVFDTCIDFDANGWHIQLPNDSDIELNIALTAEENYLWTEAKMDLEVKENDD